MINNLEIKCPIEEMWADVLTKPLQGKAFREMQAKLMNCNIDYEAQEAAFQETLVQAKAGRKMTYPAMASSQARCHPYTAVVCWGVLYQQENKSNRQANSRSDKTSCAVNNDLS